MKLGYKSLLPFAMAFFKHLQSAIKEASKYEIQIDQRKLEAFVLKKMDGWSPKIDKKNIMDEENKILCARLISNMAIKLLEKE